MKETEFIEFVAGVMEVPAAALSMATAYESIPQWDSVMHLRLTLEIGERYGVEIPVDEIAAVRTLGEFYRYLPPEPDLTPMANKEAHC